MFAILKFQQRTDAATFSHAFVLTIKICSSPEEQSVFHIKYPTARKADTDAAFKDSSATADVDNKTTRNVVHITDKTPPRKSRTYSSKRINQILKHNENQLSKPSETPVNSRPQSNIVEKSANFRERPNGRDKSATTCTVTKEHLTNNKHSTELCDGMYANKPTNGDGGRSEKDTEKNPVAHKQNQPRMAKRKDEIRAEQTDDASEETKETQKQHQEAPRVWKYHVFSSSKLTCTKMITEQVSVNEQALPDKISSDEDSIRIERADSESAVDSSKTACQQFIKKDVDNGRQDQTSAKSAASPLVLDKPVQKNSERITSEARSANGNSMSKAEGEKVNEESTRKEQQQRHETADKSSDERQIAPISTRTVDDRAQSNTYSKSYRARKQRSREFPERKTTAVDDNNKILRSSNITDLVMEGLMFTIRQDQDSVAVIEQKTKLEVDEVLENSEKVETEAGEKCLLNSSLLRLENLITMIDPPRDKDEQQRKTNNIVTGNSAYSSSLNVSNAVCHSNDIDCADRTTNDKLGISNYEGHDTTDQLGLLAIESGFHWQQLQANSNVVGNDDYSTSRNAMEWEADCERDEECAHPSDVDMMSEEEKRVEVDVEEDIVPEVLRPTVLSPAKANEDPRNTELLMDDMDVEETGKQDTFINNHGGSCLAFSSEKNSTYEPLAFSEMKSDPDKRQANVPRVISNTAITVEQMPPALQKILRYARRLSPSTTTGKTLFAYDDQKKSLENTVSIETAASVTRTSLNVSRLRAVRHQRTRNSDIVNTDSYSTDKNAMEKKEEQSMDWEDDNGKRNKKCTRQSALSEENRDAGPDTTNESVVEVTDDAKETKNENGNESRVMIDVEEADDVRSTGEESNGTTTDRISQTTLSEARTRHGSLRKLQDITTDFYHDLQAHNSATQQRCLRQRRRSLNSLEDIKNGNVRIEMFKFIQDMTAGVKVVVRRLNIRKV